MKKFNLVMSLGLIATTITPLVGCDLLGDGMDKIALVTDVGSIDDRSFNQGTWEGIVDFAEENKLELDEDYKYFVPDGGETAGTADYIAAIELAITWGAKTVVTPGFLFEEAIYAVQTAHEDVRFILLDGEPHDADYNYTTTENTLPILFKEEQSGFLAGYAAVKEGLVDVGFIGGMPVPAVVKFGTGFVAGAYYAADEEGITDFAFDPDNYWYSNVFWPMPEVVTRSASMYMSTDVIFVAAGGASASVIPSAVAAGDKMIGVDIDQSAQSQVIITSAMKGLGSAVKIALEKIRDDEFDGGETLRLGANNGGVGLPLGDGWRFQTFTKTEYDAILLKLANTTLVVPANYTDLAAFVAQFDGLAFEFTAETIGG